MVGRGSGSASVSSAIDVTISGDALQKAGPDPGSQGDISDSGCLQGYGPCVFNPASLPLVRSSGPGAVGPAAARSVRTGFGKQGAQPSPGRSVTPRGQAPVSASSSTVQSCARPVPGHLPHRSSTPASAGFSGVRQQSPSLTSAPRSSASTRTSPVPSAASRLSPQPAARISPPPGSRSSPQTVRTSPAPVVARAAAATAAQTARTAPVGLSTASASSASRSAVVGFAPSAVTAARPAAGSSIAGRQAAPAGASVPGRASRPVGSVGASVVKVSQTVTLESGFNPARRQMMPSEASQPAESVHSSGFRTRLKTTGALQALLERDAK